MKKCVALVLTSLVFAGWMRASPATATIPATVFKITNYGAVGDGAQDNTTNIQNAIDTASAAGGGVVEVPEGRFLSGPITLRSRIHLQVDAGATLQMLPFGTYPGGTTGAQTFIACNDIHDLEISGPGTIDGQGAAWWAAFMSRTNSRLVRPMMLNLTSVDRLFIHDIRFQNPPYHHCGLRGHGGNITISNLTVETRSPSPNTDGLNFVGTNSIIENCHISTGDDNIAMGSTGIINDLLITNCDFGFGHGVSIGSGIVGISNLTVANCSFTGTQSGIRIKCPMGRGGPVEDLNYVNLTMTNVNLPIVIYSYYNRIGTPHRITPEDVLATNNLLPVTRGTPVWRDITFSNVTAVAGRDIGGIIWGPTEMPVSNVTLVRVTNTAPSGIDLYNVRGVKIQDSQFNFGAGDTFTLCNADVSISNSTASGSAVRFNDSRGSNVVVQQGQTLKLSQIATGPFKAEWDSLTNYQTPEWFRDAKFGIWAHWGPQCEPEHGDWYGRFMYVQGHPDYKSHLAEYGHPSTNGFKDVIHEWKAADFDPDKLLKFYKENGAKYFMALAVHHDNFDNWNSKFQPWNAVNVGPHKDLIGGWAAAARKNGLRFAVSVHASHAWSWYEVAQDADKSGPLAGVPYDGKLTKADGKGLWWDGLDPQDLYAQNHAPGKKLVWDWNASQGSSVPDAAYMEKFYNRTKQLWDDYRPDMVYFDDDVLPLHGVTDEVGLNLLAHFYNTSMRWHHGRNEAVITDKHLNAMQQAAQVYDIERGRADRILPLPWQTDTCIGSWHYDQAIFKEHRYKTAAVVIPLLADVVSKNGNLMLSVPLQRGGQPDTDEIKIVQDIGAWLKVNGEAIYATRPWRVYGEGPSTEVAERGQFGGQSDFQKRPFTAQDIRFTQSRDGKTLYAIVLAFPTNGQMTIKSLASNSELWHGKIRSVRMLGVSGGLKFSRDAAGLDITLPKKQSSQIAFALRIKG